MLRCFLLSEAAANGNTGGGSFLFIFKIMIMPYTINILLFGIGNLGSSLIDKAIRQRKKLLKEGLNIRFSVITNSQAAFFDKGFAKYSWETNLPDFPIPFDFNKLVQYISDAKWENTLIIDASNSAELPLHYIGFLSRGFNVITVNKHSLQLPESYRQELALQCLYKYVQYKELVSANEDKGVVALAILNTVLQDAGNIPVI